MTNARLPLGNSWFHEDSGHYLIFMELRHSVNLKRLTRVPNLWGARLQALVVQADAPPHRTNPVWVRVCAVYDLDMRLIL